MSGYNEPDGVTAYACPDCGHLTNGGGDVECACQAFHEALADEAVSLACELDDLSCRFRAMTRRVRGLMCLGKWDEAKAALDEEQSLRECWDGLSAVADRLAT